jgi:transcriptional regulator with XRE-family HTH domain
LSNLFSALGLKLDDFLDEEIEAISKEIVGYMATPLTGLSDEEDVALNKLIGKMREVAARPQFLEPPFQLYWPGDNTHPKKHKSFTPNQVYLIDRSRASTFDFILMLCVTPSYGVGQENEIASQAGLPAIRLIPPQITRMMTGSFIDGIDVVFDGSLSTGINFDGAALQDAFAQVRIKHFKHRALYGKVNGNSFGERLRKLLADRSGDYKSFAAEIGISSLMDEPFAVTNPSARLLKRMGIVLDVSVGYLLGETPESDPIIAESYANWKTWIDESPGLDAQIVLMLKKSWTSKYLNSRTPVSVSKRDEVRSMRVQDWDKDYQRYKKGK